MYVFHASALTVFSLVIIDYLLANFNFLFRLIINFLLFTFLFVMYLLDQLLKALLNFEAIFSTNLNPGDLIFLSQFHAFLLADLPLVIEIAFGAD